MSLDNSARREALQRRQTRDATRLQAQWRMSKARSAYHKRLDGIKRTAASTKLQTKWRGHRERRKFLRHREAQAHKGAAVVVQSLFRRYQARALAQARREEQVLFQTQAERDAYNEKLRKEREEALKVAPFATTIQKNWRGKIGCARTLAVCFLPALKSRCRLLSESTIRSSCMVQAAKSVGTVFLRRCSVGSGGFARRVEEVCHVEIVKHVSATAAYTLALMSEMSCIESDRIYCDRFVSQGKCFHVLVVQERTPWFRIHEVRGGTNQPMSTWPTLSTLTCGLFPLAPFVVVGTIPM